MHIGILGAVVNRKACIILGALALWPHPARADGGFFPRREAWKEQRERALITEPAQKAALLFQNGREQLIISPGYQGPPGDFAWVVPVPSRPQVKILHGALFHELARIVEPAPPRRFAPEAAKAAGGGGMRASVIVLERKTVGAYDVSVLSATDGGALAKWLDRNGYFMPPRAIRPLAGYVREKWTFVACRIKLPANARGLQRGELAPLSLTFATPKPVYPMRLSAINPAPFSLLLYLLLPGGMTRPALLTWPGAFPQGRFASVPGNGGDAPHPTLDGLHANIQHILWTKTNIAPQDCTRDYVWGASH